MKSYIYPAILYYVPEDDDYMLHIEDLDVFAYGETVEEVQHNANDLLASYVQLSLRLLDDMPESTPFDQMRRKYPDYVVLLVEVVVDENTKKVIKKQLQKA